MRAFNKCNLYFCRIIHAHLNKWVCLKKKGKRSYLINTLKNVQSASKRCAYSFTKYLQDIVNSFPIRAKIRLILQWHYIHMCLIYNEAS